ncbi:MAG: hypothetical protein P4L61_00535 [Candidatus Pacebacteria bacterium]|nr:hypothetical protein [Candidatus Paceibacterota bacterium]
MKKLRAQHYILLFLSIMALLVAGSAYAFMYKDTIRKAQEESMVQQEALAASKQTTESKDRQTTFETSAASRALLPSFLVSTEDAVPFIDSVEAVGPATGSVVSISSLSSGTDSGTSYQAVTATVSASGKWTNVMRAVEMIENMPYAISVKTLNLDASSAATQKSATNWTATIAISVLSSS